MRFEAIPTLPMFDETRAKEFYLMKNPTRRNRDIEAARVSIFVC